MTPTEYVQEIILPTLREYLSEGSDRRKAMLACMTLVHLHDALKEAQVRQAAETTAEFFDLVRKACSECWTVYLVGISAKHMQHAKSGFRVDSVVERAPAEWGEAEWDRTRWDDPIGGVEALGVEGGDQDIESAIRVAFTFLTKTFVGREFTIEGQT